MSLVTTPSAETVIGCAIKVHRELGPGLFESVYHPCLAHEMAKAGLQFDSEVSLQVIYDGIVMPRAFSTSAKTSIVKPAGSLILSSGSVL